MLENKAQMKAQEKMNIDVSTLRWIMFTKKGPVVENHSHGRTWKKAYKDNHGNIQALCLQNIPTASKYFVKESPLNEYWTFEEFEYNMAGSSTHISRSICSLQQVNLKDPSQDLWEVLTVDAYGVHNSKQTSKDIGFDVRNYIDKDAWKI